MDVALRSGEYDELPDRTSIIGYPTPNILYRDPAYPRLVFRGSTRGRGFNWSAVYWDAYGWDMPFETTD